MVHEVAASGFSNPADYEAARPSYPPEAVAWLVERLGIGPGRRVFDLAAGTGKFTRLLVDAGADLVAGEPVAGMRAEFRAQVPTVPLLATTAETLSLRDAGIDVLTVAQAWHWFDADRAAAEARRVVRPGGGIGLIWNARDRGIEWADAIWSIMDRVEKHAPWRNHDNWRESLQTLPGFEAPETAEFRHTHVLKPESVTQRVASVSHVAVLPSKEREAILDEVRAVLAEHPDTRGRDAVELAYRTDCIASRRQI